MALSAGVTEHAFTDTPLKRLVLGNTFEVVAVRPPILSASRRPIVWTRSSRCRHNSPRGSMPRVAPSPPRARLREEVEALRIDIPLPRNWLLLLFVPVWLIGWAMGLISVGSGVVAALAQGRMSGLFLIAWLVLWLAGGVFISYAWLLNLIGREVVRIDRSKLVLRSEIGGLGRSREFDLTHVRDLRATPAPFNPRDFKSTFQFWGIGGGSIAFDYGAKTERFGAGLDEAKAKQLVLHLKQRFSFPDN